MDSHVLLHALARLRDAGAIRDLKAVHINHGLHHQSAAWGQLCLGYADALQVPLDIVEVDAAAAPGESPEASARYARYAALADVIDEHACLLTAHHQDDQAETLLLQLLRGSGPRGMASMPAQAVFGAGQHLRPLLGFTRHELAGYAREHNLQWIEDPGNEDSMFARNYIRHEVMPVLRARWPSAAQTMARSAARCADMTGLIEPSVRRRMDGLCGDDGALDIDGLLDLEAGWQREVIRHWLRQAGLPLPATAHVAQILAALHCPDDRMPRVTWPGVEVRRYRHRLYAMPAPGDESQPGQMIWRHSHELQLPEPAGGRLLARHVDGEGLRTDVLPDCLNVRFRVGGERCRPARRGGSRSLKKLFQEYGVATWLRARIPLLYIDDELAAVPGLFVCAPFAAAPDQPGMVPLWIREDNPQ